MRKTAHESMRTGHEAKVFDDIVRADGISRKVDRLRREHASEPAAAVRIRELCIDIVERREGAVIALRLLAQGERNPRRAKMLEREADFQASKASMALADLENYR